MLAWLGYLSLIGGRIISMYLAIADGATCFTVKIELDDTSNVTESQKRATLSLSNQILLCVYEARRINGMEDET